MARTTLTSKGQVTIPAEIRTALQLQAGDCLVLHLTDGGFTASVERTPRVKDVYGRFKQAAQPGTTHAEERAAIEEAVAGKYAP